MSRHRNLRGVDFKEEYDDYYNNSLDDSFERKCNTADDDDYDDDLSDEDEIDDFEARYLNTGIDLNLKPTHSKQGANAPSTNITPPATKATVSAYCDKRHIDSIQQDVVDKIFTQESSQSSARVTELEESLLNSIFLPRIDQLELRNKSSEKKNDRLMESNEKSNKSQDGCLGFSNLQTTVAQHQHNLVNQVFSDTLSKMAITHLTQNQWQLPILEMDSIFRDKTYFKHYTDFYLSNLQSKLGLFLKNSPPKLTSSDCNNPYNREKMLSILVDYYDNLNIGYFSFTTPSPDEEIAIGCRFGSKAKPMQPRKKDVPKANESNNQQTRFQYGGTKANINQSTTKPSSQKPSTSRNQNINQFASNKEVTIRQDFDVTKVKQHTKETVNKPYILPAAKSAKSTEQQVAVHKTAVPKQLQTLTEKRNNKQRDLTDKSLGVSKQDLKKFKERSKENIKNYQLLLEKQDPSINLIVVGHVDAGKSTLIGHLLFKLGLVSNKLMHRYTTDSQRSGKASFKFAWILDETDEERSRGVTMDIASTRIQTQNRDINLIDAPGHSDFIPAVITGAAQADSAILVVDATRGEFETGFANGGQTREHLLLIRSLGVKSLIVIVNKMDNVDWDEIRFNHIVDQLKPFIKVVGYDTNSVRFIPCSGLSGSNLTTQLKQTKIDPSHPQLERDWYDGPTLLDCIDQLEPPPRDIDKPLRLCITDVFKGMSTGISLGGTIEGGQVQEKQKCLLMPQNEYCEVKTIEMKDTRTKQAFAGDSVTLVVTGIDLAKFFRGSVLCDPLLPASVTNRFQARIVTFNDIDTILLKGSPIEIHMNGLTEPGRIRKLVSLLNKSTGDLIQKRPKCIAKNSSAMIEIVTGRVLCVELYENYKNLGRFLIRSMGKTIAAGLVSKICKPKFEKSTKKHRK